VFERFTDRAREVVALAQSEARSLRHNYIGTEHLLLAMLSQTDGPAARVLEELGVTRERIRTGVVEWIGEGTLSEPDADALEVLGIDLEEVRRRTEEAFGPGALKRTRAARALRGRRWFRRRCDGGGHGGFTPRAKKVLELAIRESLSLAHRYVGTEHVLLGVLREGEGVAAQLLHKEKVDYKVVRRKLLDEVGGYADSG